MILPAAHLVSAKQIGRTVMCALCGVLGGPEHWTDAVARPGVFTRNTDAAARRRERMNRVAAHPDVSGRPHVLMMLERLYHHMIGHPGVRFVTMNEMADDFARRSPRQR